MRRCVEGADRGQTTLLPECLGDWVEESNPVRAVDVFVEALDLADRAPPRTHRPREQDCSLQPSHQGIPGAASFARDPPPQRSASSDPSANRAGIISPESNPAARFYTAWTQTRPKSASHKFGFGVSGLSERCKR